MTGKPKQDEPPKPNLQPEEKKDPSRKAQEWGERIETGKGIARGGKSDGPVKGATEKPPEKSD